MMPMVRRGLPSRVLCLEQDLAGLCRQAARALSPPDRSAARRSRAGGRLRPVVRPGHGRRGVILAGLRALRRGRRQALEQQLLHARARAAAAAAAAAAATQAGGQQLLVVLQGQLVLDVRLCAAQNM